MPRTIPQAEALEARGIHFDAVVSIEILDEVIEGRMTGAARLHGAAAPATTSPPIPPRLRTSATRAARRCPSARMTHPETVKSRLQVFHAETEPLKDFYAKLGLLKLVEGNQPIDSATQDILKALGM